MRAMLRLAVRGIQRVPKNLLLNSFHQPILVLTYHRIVSVPYDPVISTVSVDTFRDHVRFLKKHFNMFRMEDIHQKQATPSVLLTFDDGYADNYLNALPILEEEKVPGVFFVCTGKIDTKNEFWWDELEHCIFEPERPLSSFEFFGKKWDVSTDDRSKMLLFHEILRQLILLKKTDQDREMKALKSQFHIPDEGRESHRLMTLEELRKMSASPYATIGAHTIHHMRNSILSRKEQNEEILGSKRQLQQWIEKDVNAFAFPYGRPTDISGEAIGICQDAGFKYVFTTIMDQVRSNGDPMWIPRFPVRDWDMGLFWAALSAYKVI